MQSKLLHGKDGLRTFALVFEKDEEVKAPLSAFAVENGIRSAQVTAIGAFSEVTLGSSTDKKRAIRRFR
jgi:predicted DNA-binding protein with PD1-like motif